MAIGLKQNLNLSQQLVMTPQLQQAIKLLQLSRVELEEMVVKELQENPALEEGPAEEAESGSEQPRPETPLSAPDDSSELVLNRIAAPDRPAQKYTIPTQLVRRESSGPPLKFSARTPGFSESSITNA